MISGSPIHLTLGDITRFTSDAIVNAANPQLTPGGGVSGAIHRAAGRELASACAEYVREHGAVTTGSAALTPGFRLPARYVIHAVGPVWSGGAAGEALALAGAYRACIELADAHGDIRTVAFPSISTGIYGYPLDLAAPVALAAVQEALAVATHVREATFVLFNQRTFDAYHHALST